MTSGDWWVIWRNAVTAGTALAVVGGVAVLLFHGFGQTSWRNVAVIASLIGAILAFSGDVATRRLGPAADREKVLEQPLLSADVSFRLLLRPDENSTDKKHDTNAVVFMDGEEAVLVATHPMNRSGHSPEGLMTVRADLDTEAGGTAMGQPLAELSSVKQLVIVATPIPFPCRILEGEVVCTLNGSVVLKLPMRGARQAEDGAVVVDLAEGLLAAGGL